MQHTRLRCLPPTPRACSNSCPPSPWCHPAISSFAIPFNLLPSIFLRIKFLSSESDLLIRRPKDWSFSFSISPSNEYQDWFPLGWTGLISSQSKGLFNSLLQHSSLKASILQSSAFFMVQLSHPHMTTGKNIALTRWNFVSKVMSLLFNMLSRLALAFLPRSKHLLIYGCSHHLQGFGALENKVCH